MKRLFLPLMAAAVAVLMVDSAFAAAPGMESFTQSTRVVSADGTFAVTFPCGSKDVIRETDTSPMACLVGGVFFGAQRGAPKIMIDGKLSQGNFDSFLQAVRASLGSANVSELLVSGHRAFQYFCANSDGQPCKLVIEMPSGQPLMLTGGDNPAPTKTAAAWHQISPQVASFFRSLEFLAK